MEGKIAVINANTALIIETLSNKLEKSRFRESQYTARGLIEYVENFRMPAVAGNKKPSREARWTNFFTNDPTGQKAYLCILNANPMWPKGAANIADRLASAYQFPSDPHHPSAHEIEDGLPFIVVKGSMVVQLYKLAECLNTALQLQGQFPP